MNKGKTGIILLGMIALLFCLFTGKQTTYAAEGYDEEFWSVFHEEYADDPEYLKLFDLYNSVDVEAEVTLADSEDTGNKLTVKSPFTDTTYTLDKQVANKKLVHGIDVSKWQGEIDWAKVKNAGIKRAVIRCGFTSTKEFVQNTDPYFKQNMEQAKANGIEVGVYFFSQATSPEEAVIEAEYALKLVEGYQLDLPLYFDEEDGTYFTFADFTKRQVTDFALAFCDRVTKAGYKTGAYGSASKLVAKGGKYEVSEILSKGYFVWVARYNTVCSDTKYSVDGYHCWQYSSDGTVPGISGRVDCDFFFDDPVQVTPPSSGEVTEEKLDTPKLPSISVGDGKLTVSWEAVPKAEKYRVYRKTSASGEWKELVTTNGLSYTDKDVSSGTTYYYTVSCINEETREDISDKNETGKAFTYVSCPVISSVANTETGIKVSWDAPKGAKKYLVYRKTDTTSWSRLKEVEATSYVDTSAAAGKKYSYTVRVVDSKGNLISFHKSTGTCLRLEQPKVIRANTANGIKCTWNKITGAKGYRVYRKEVGGSYARIADISGGDTLSYQDDAVKSKNGTVYYYTVRAVNGSYLSSYTNFKMVRLSGVSISGISSPSKGDLTVKWGSNAKAGGYQIQYSKSSSFSSATTVNLTGTSKTFSKLASGTKYYVRVRPYKVVTDFKYYGPWSATKNITVR